MLDDIRLSKSSCFSSGCFLRIRPCSLSPSCACNKFIVPSKMLKKIWKQASFAEFRALHNIRRSASPIKPFPCRKHQHWSRTNTVISTKNFFQTSQKGYLQIKPSSFPRSTPTHFHKTCNNPAYTLQTQLAMLTNCGKTGMQRWQMCWISTPLRQRHNRRRRHRLCPWSTPALHHLVLTVFGTLHMIVC